MKNFNTTDTEIINLFLSNITKSCNIETNNYHIVIIKNFKNMKKNNQETFKSFIDKSNTTCRFIFITNQICKISNSIIDRCTQMRIPVLSKYDTAVLSNKILNKNNINITKNQFIELIEDTSNNAQFIKIYID